MNNLIMSLPAWGPYLAAAVCVLMLVLVLYDARRLWIEHRDLNALRPAGEDGDEGFGHLHAESDIVSGARNHG